MPKMKIFFFNEAKKYGAGGGQETKVSLCLALKKNVTIQRPNFLTGPINYYLCLQTLAIAAGNLGHWLGSANTNYWMSFW